MQWLSRLQEALGERINDDETTEQGKAEVIYHKKCVSAVLAMVKASKKGVESEDFVDACHRQLRFLKSMPPIVQGNLFPDFIRLAAKKMTVEKSVPGPGFWASLSPKSLGDSSLSLKAASDLQAEVL